MGGMLFFFFFFYFNNLFHFISTNKPAEHHLFSVDIVHQDALFFLIFQVVRCILMVFLNFDVVFDALQTAWCTPNNMMHLLFSTLNYQQKKYPVLPWPAIFIHRKHLQKPWATISANTSKSNVCLCTGNTPIQQPQSNPSQNTGQPNIKMVVVWWSCYDGHHVPHLYRCQYCYVKNYTTRHYNQTIMYHENKPNIIV